MILTKEKKIFRPGAKRTKLMKGKYTQTYYDECAELAKKHTDNYLSTRLVELLLKSLGKSQEVEVEN